MEKIASVSYFLTFAQWKSG